MYVEKVRKKIKRRWRRRCLGIRKTLGMEGESVWCIKVNDEHRGDRETASVSIREASYRPAGDVFIILGPTIHWVIFVFTLQMHDVEGEYKYRYMALNRNY